MCCENISVKGDKLFIDILWQLRKDGDTLDKQSGKLKIQPSNLFRRQIESLWFDVKYLEERGTFLQSHSHCHAHSKQGNINTQLRLSSLMSYCLLFAHGKISFRGWMTCFMPQVKSTGVQIRCGLPGVYPPASQHIAPMVWSRMELCNPYLKGTMDEPDNTRTCIMVTTASLRKSILHFQDTLQAIELSWHQASLREVEFWYQPVQKHFGPQTFQLTSL